jgi:Ion channel
VIAFFTILRLFYFTFKVSIPAFATSLTPELAR